MLGVLHNIVILDFHLRKVNCQSQDDYVFTRLHSVKVKRQVDKLQYRKSRNALDSSVLV